MLLFHSLNPSSVKIGIIRERKSEPDARVPLTPVQVAFLRNQLDIDLVVESSPIRCFDDEEYRAMNVPVVDDTKDCEVLLGVKEVPIEHLAPGRIHFFFSHTIKKQTYNLDLLRAVLDKRVRLIDYELLVNTYGHRIIAFGHFAGMVGAHNALWTWAQRTRQFELPRLFKLSSYEAAKEHYAKAKWPNVKIVLTGTGRVGTGALLTLSDMGIRQVDPKSFLEESFDHPVFTQLLPHHYAADKDGDDFDKSLFYNNPAQFKSTFLPYAQAADILIHGIYWVNDAPVFFTLEEMQRSDFKIKVIADITCDIAPISSIPSTLRSTSIADPIYGFDPFTGRETTPHLDRSVDMMTISNLPNELPKEASKSFGKQFITAIMSELLKNEPSEMLDRATIAQDGRLKPGFAYLQDWVDGNE